MFRIITLLTLLLFAFGANAECPEFFIKGQIPSLVNQKLSEKTQQLCFSEFGLLYSGVTRTPLWSAEHLTGEHIQSGRGLPRRNAFHEEEQIQEDERATLDDYRRSGYDRGHMSPNGDMSTAQAKEETFTLANMVPQSPCNNEVIWEGIESAVRALAQEVGDVYIVTGPAFIGNELESLKGRVLIPSNIWKAVYIPSRNEAMAYWTPNNDTLKWELVTIAKLKELTGIDVFPELDKSIKEHEATTFPLPEAPRFGCRIHH